MSYSLNEIEALSKRAARGAGYSWGMSEEIGKATRWLCSYRLPGIALLADLLVRNDKCDFCRLAPISLKGIWSASDGILNPIITGAALSDCAGQLAMGPSLEMKDVSHPLLVAPFAALSALYLNAPIILSWQDVQINTDGYGLGYTDPEKQISAVAPVSMICSCATAELSEFAKPGSRANVDNRDMKILNTFAHRTYAPATEESRRLGAGAGNGNHTT